MGGACGWALGSVSWSGWSLLYMCDSWVKPPLWVGHLDGTSFMGGACGWSLIYGWGLWMGPLDRPCGGMEPPYVDRSYSGASLCGHIL